MGIKKNEEAAILYEAALYYASDNPGKLAARRLKDDARLLRKAGYEQLANHLSDHAEAHRTEWVAETKDRLVNITRPSGPGYMMDYVLLQAAQAHLDASIAAWRADYGSSQGETADVDRHAGIALTYLTEWGG